MVKIINQDTFNDAVKENQEMFDLNIEDAVKETVEQFEKQASECKNLFTFNSILISLLRSPSYNFLGIFCKFDIFYAFGYDCPFQLFLSLLRST